MTFTQLKKQKRELQGCLGIANKTIFEQMDKINTLDRIVKFQAQEIGRLKEIPDEKIIIEKANKRIEEYISKNKEPGIERTMHKITEREMAIFFQTKISKQKQELKQYKTMIYISLVIAIIAIIVAVI